VSIVNAMGWAISLMLMDFGSNRNSQ
jgi:hypothetical protein